MGDVKFFNQDRDIYDAFEQYFFDQSSLSDYGIR